MTTFNALGIAGTGLTVHRKWLDAVSDNLANVNTVRPTDQEAFRARYVVAQAVNYGQPAGVQVAGREEGDGEAAEEVKGNVDGGPEAINVEDVGGEFVEEEDGERKPAAPRERGAGGGNG